MFMYTASEVYGKDSEMRHNSQTTKSFTNNNNSNNHNDQHIPLCNVDNALNYYKKNVNLIGVPWKLKSPSRSSNPSPSKTRQICRSNYAVPTSESLHYSDAYVKSYAPRKVSGATSGATTTIICINSYGNNNNSKPIIILVHTTRCVNMHTVSVHLLHRK